MFARNKYFYKIVYLTVCLLAVLGFTVGYIYTSAKIKNEQMTKIGSYEGDTNGPVIYNDSSTKDVANTSEPVEQGKLIMKTYYTVCKHTITEEAKMPPDVSKLSLEQLKNAYRDWTVEKFSPNEIIITKNIDSKCPNHYIVKVKNDRVAVFYQSPLEGVSLKELTDIAVSSLSESDQLRLQKGILIENNEKLAELLEDLGS